MVRRLRLLSVGALSGAILAEDAAGVAALSSLNSQSWFHSLFLLWSFITAASQTGSILAQEESATPFGAWQSRRAG
jgi:hypothetical protein